MNWLIAANSSLYDHASSFAHYGSIDWRQGNYKYSVGDIVYIYCTNPIKQIRYKCRVTRLNKTSNESRDDKQYWLDLEEYKKALSGKFFNLELIEEVDSELLKLDYLLENGINGAPQGALKLSEQALNYIDAILKQKMTLFSQIQLQQILIFMKV